MFYFFRNFIFIVCFSFLLCSPNAFAISAEKLRESLDEVDDFSHFSARPFQTASCKEAFEALITHARSMIDYHEDMENMYRGRVIRYADPSKKRYLSIFLKSTLGFNVPSITDPYEYLKRLPSIHERFSTKWKGILIGLTGEVVIINGASTRCSNVLEPSYESSQKVILKLHAYFKESRSLLGSSVNLEEMRNNKLMFCYLDDLWALRYAHALIEPWAKTDEELKKEKEEAKAERKKEKKRSKKKKYRERKRLDKTRARQEKVPFSGDEEEEEEEEEHFVAAQDPLTIEKAAEGMDGEQAQAPEASEEDGDFDPEAFAENQRRLSFQKRQSSSSSQVSSANEEESNSPTTCFYIDKGSYSCFCDLFHNRLVSFDRFIKAFQRLGGKYYKNRGGSIRTFQLGKYSFNLHQPHGGKGKAMFYYELRRRALHHLEVLGINEGTLREQV